MLAAAATSILDFFGIAALLPVLYYLLTDNDNQRAALLFGTFAIIFIFSKSVIGIWLHKYQSKYLTDLFNRLSLTLYREYFSKGLIFIRSHGTSRIGYELTWVCQTFCQKILGTLLKLTGDILLLILTGTTVLILAPTSFLILCIPVAIALIIFRNILGIKAQEEGLREMNARRNQSRIICDTFGGYSDIMINEAALYFEEKLSSSLNDIGRSHIKVELYSRSILPLCETAVAISLAFIAYMGSGEGTKIAIGFFAIAAFRVIPAIKGLISGWIQIKNASFSFEIISKLNEHVAIQNTATIEKTHFLFGSGLTLKDITFCYPNEKTPLIRNLSINIKQGEYIGFRGESGIGKSTLFNIILGLIMPDSGTVEINGIVLTKENRCNWLTCIGYVPQEVYVFNSSLASNIALGIKDPDLDKISRIIKEVHLLDWFSTLPNGLDTILGERGLTLSGGERQRLGLARALYREISVLMLDEATSALDNETEAEVLHTIERIRRARSLTILSIAHRSSSLANADRIVSI